MAEVTIKERGGALLAQAAGYIGLRTIEVGLKHGLIAKLAEHPEGLTVEQLAHDAGVDAFYAGVWARAAYGAEVIDTVVGDGDGTTYRLAEHVGTLLLDQDSPAYIGALFKLLDQPELFDRFSEVLTSGEHIWWDQTGPGWIDGVSGTGRAYYNRLIPGGLSQVPGVTARLEAGARVLELAAGVGVGLVKLATAYPNAEIVGMDGDAYSLELAAKRLGEAGLEGRVELIRSTLEDLDVEGFDLAIINISMHEARDLDKVAENVRRALEPGGIFVISDFPFPEDHEALRTVPARLMLGVQFFEAMIDDQLLPTKAFVELLDKHGFTDVGTADLTPLHALTFGRR